MSTPSSRPDMPVCSMVLKNKGCFRVTTDVELDSSTTESKLPQAMDPADVKVGRRLRALRLQRGLPLAEVAQTSGISIGALSQIERGITSLRVKTLWPLAAALDVEPHSLLDERSERASSLYIVRRGERRGLPVGSEGITKDLLSPAGAALTGLHVRIEPGCGTAGTYAHQGQEFGLVLLGEVDLVIDDVSYQLQAGDSFAFKSTLPHAFRNGGSRMCEIVWVNTVKPLDVGNGA